MEHERLLKILRTISDLNENNIIERVKEKLNKEDPDTYKKWQDNGFDINYTLDDQSTLLHIAARNNLVKIAELLIKKGAKVDAAGQDGWTVLHCAAYNGHKETVELLLNRGADVNAADKNRNTPLHCAAYNGHKETVELLLNRGADVNAADKNRNTPLHCAAYNGHKETVELLLNRGAKIDAADQDGWTVLHFAADNGHKEIVELLLDKEAKIDAADKNGWTVLHFAADNGHKEIVELLLDKEANVDAADQVGLTPLHRAAYNSHKETVELLLNRGAKIDAADQIGRTILHHAVSAKNCQVEIVKAIIKKGAAIDIADECGRTPLCFAVRKGYSEVVRILLENKVDPLSKCKSFNTLKLLIELIKNDFKHPKKAEETQQQEDDEYELIKYSLLLRNDCSLIDFVERSAFGKLISTWLADTSNLTESEKKLNKKFLSIFKDLPHVIREDYQNDVKKVKEFLLDHKSNKDLKTILNLKRGESKVTILHMLSSMECGNSIEFMNLLLEAGADPNEKDGTGRAPLHYVARSDCYSVVALLLEKGANRDIQDNKGETPMEIAINNINFDIKKSFLTDKEKILLEKLLSASGSLTKLKELLNEHKNTQDKEKSLFKKLLSASENPTKLQELLSEHENTQDFKRISCLFSAKKESQVFTKDVLYGTYRKKTQIDFHEKDKCINLWNDLMLQNQDPSKHLDSLNEAQDIDKLEQAVNKAIESGVRFNLPDEKDIYKNTYESNCNFTDYVIKRIGELEKSFRDVRDIEVASRIVCNLVSKGAVVETLSSMIVIDKLEKFKDHKANLKKARKGYVRYSLNFLEAAKSASAGKVKEAKMDNFNFYLKYSKNSIVDVTKIINGTDESTELRRSVIAIGKSEIEILTKGGTRTYADLTGNIVLTFHTDLGKVDVRLYNDVQDKNKIIVAVSNKEEILEKFKNYKKELGENCLLGKCYVYDAIEQGYFTNFEESKSSETIISHEEVLEKDSTYRVSSSLKNISLSPIVQQGTEKIRSRG